MRRTVGLRVNIEGQPIGTSEGHALAGKRQLQRAMHMKMGGEQGQVSWVGGVELVCSLLEAKTRLRIDFVET